MEKEVDVAVVGAGPVGLPPVIELTLGVARVLVPERPDCVDMEWASLSGGGRMAR